MDLLLEKTVENQDWAAGPLWATGPLSCRAIGAVGCWAAGLLLAKQRWQVVVEDLCSNRNKEELVMRLDVCHLLPICTYQHFVRGPLQPNNDHKPTCWCKRDFEHEMSCSK